MCHEGLRTFQPIRYGTLYALTSGMTRFIFIWSPEGRQVYTTMADTRKQAIAAFRKLYGKSYARYMPEVYIHEVAEGETYAY